MQEMLETLIQYLSWEDPLQEVTATHSSILAWRVPMHRDPGRLQSIGPQSQTSLKQLSTSYNANIAIYSFLQLDYIC